MSVQSFYNKVSKDTNNTEESIVDIDAQTQQIYECLYNGIFVFFCKVLKGKVGLLSIKKNTGVYSIFTENNQNFFTMEQIKKFIQDIEQIEMLDKSGDRGIGDADPLYDFEKKCL